MPKVKPLINRPKWENELLRKIGAAKTMTGMSYPKICKTAGINYSTFMLHLRHPSEMRYGEMNVFLETCEKLTGG